MMIHNKENYQVYHGLKLAIENPDTSKRARDIAKQILNDKELFERYVLLKKDKAFLEQEKAEAIERKKVRDEKKKNLTRWKKWAILILPDGLILR